MSKIVLTPNASGTGTFTIQSPDSNTDRTLTLPDRAGELSVSITSANDPAVDSNPDGGVGTVWTNSTSGKMYVLTDATEDANVWKAGGGGGGVSADLVASGAITSGQMVGLNANGTVSVTRSETSGSPVDFETDEIIEVKSTYDSTNNKVIIVYGGPSPYKGEAVIGTVSGNTITFGTPVTFRSTNVTAMGVAYSPDHECIVIAYRVIGGGNHSYAIVGDVSSGTTITFGSEVKFDANQSSSSSVAYHETEQKFVIGFKGSASDHGVAIVGTVSGTNITFGSQQDFYNNTAYDIVVKYDPDQDRILFYYRQYQGHAHARTATLSGTTLTFAAELVVYGALTTGLDIAYHSAAQKFVATYAASGNIYARQITVDSSGVLTLGTHKFLQSSAGASQVVYDPNSQRLIFTWKFSTGIRYIYAVLDGNTFDEGLVQYYTDDLSNLMSLVYDEGQGRIVMSYDNDSDNKGTAVVFDSGNFSSFIGSAVDDIADGNSGEINLLGSLNESQTSLTTGSTYYLDKETDGGLTVSTSSGTIAGRALSSTQVLLKGV